MDRNKWFLVCPGHLTPVVPYVGTWIEISIMRIFSALVLSRSLRGNVDRNDPIALLLGVSLCRSLRGNVDRNPISRCAIIPAQVVPYVGTWIEIKRSLYVPISSLRVVPYVGTWIEILTYIGINSANTGRSLRGNVDRNANVRLLLTRAYPSFPTWERG